MNYKRIRPGYVPDDDEIIDDGIIYGYYKRREIEEAQDEVTHNGPFDEDHEHDSVLDLGYEHDYF